MKATFLVFLLSLSSQGTDYFDRLAALYEKASMPGLEDFVSKKTLQGKIVFWNHKDILRNSLLATLAVEDEVLGNKKYALVLPTPYFGKEIDSEGIQKILKEAIDNERHSEVVLDSNLNAATWTIFGTSTPAVCEVQSRVRSFTQSGQKYLVFEFSLTDQRSICNQADFIYGKVLGRAYFKQS